MAFAIPTQLAAACENDIERTRWLQDLPAMLHDLEQRWNLRLGEPFDGPEVSCSWVAPVFLADQTAAVLKLGLPHMEGDHEIDGLRFWAGDPTVNLLEADRGLNAMLLERCIPGTPLRTLPEAEQDVVMAALLRRLWRTPPARPFRPLAVMTELWSGEALAKREQWRDQGVVAEGLRLFEQLPGTATAHVVLATDLHAGNVLRSKREPWLVIDPKPFVGEPAYDATQHLLNCYDRMCAEPQATIHRFAELLELDPERLRLWMFARAAVQAGDEWQDDRWLQLARVIGTP